MRVNSFNSQTNNPIVLCLGGFDSIHLGHKKLILKAKELKNELNLDLAVFTYDNDIGSIGGKSGGLVFTYEERLSILNDLGVDEICLSHFSKEYANILPMDFLNQLVKNRNISALVCGKDFKFGKNASGNTDLLQEFCLKRSLRLCICDFEYDKLGNKISTTQIKKCLEVGDIAAVNQLLGNKYFIEGEVVKGRQVGKTLGFPTANVEFPVDKCMPKSAVYATTVCIDGKEYKGITNVGNAPTFNCEHNLIECHIDGFSGDLYGKKLKICFDFFIRNNQKFNSVNQLILQLEEDLKVIR